MEFGEVLVDVRERLEIDLPIRVRQSRVFLSAFIESTGGLAAVFFRRNYVPLLITNRSGLPDFKSDLREIRQEFAKLETLPCSQEQLMQANEVLTTELGRRHARHQCERDLWGRAVQAGLFSGFLLLYLLLSSAILSMVTLHPWGKIVSLVGFLLLVGISFICVNRHNR